MDRLTLLVVVRRLPVLQSSSEESEQRPPWHYVIIGAGFTLTIWLPLAAVATWLGSRLALMVLGAADQQALTPALDAASASQKAWASVLQVLPLMLSFFLACLASAMLVGRFGGAAGTKQAILGNLSGSAVVLGLAALAGPLAPPVAFAAAAFLGLASLGAGFLGARWGRRLRPGPHT